MRWQGEPTKRRAAKLIAAAFLGGPLDEGAQERVAEVTNASAKAIRGLAGRLIAYFGTKGRPREVRVRRFVWEDRGFQRFSSKEGFECPTDECPEEEFWPREMLPAGGPPRGWKVLPITTVGELATRLNLSANE